MIKEKRGDDDSSNIDDQDRDRIYKKKIKWKSLS